MIREEYLRRLIDASHVDLYLSAVDGARVYWPFRMQPVHEASKRHRNACERYIIDSSFKDESITNEDVLDIAVDLKAEAAVLADVWQDVDATVDALVDGLEQYENHAYDGEVLLPLQPPHDQCYRKLIERGVSPDHIFAIGGVKDAGDAAKIQGAKAVRKMAPEVYIHGLGFGVTDELVGAIRDDPDLLDSLDYSTPIQNAMDGSVEAGEERMSVVAARAGSKLIEDCRRLTPFVDGPDHRQATLVAANGDRNARSVGTAAKCSGGSQDAE